MRALAPQRHIVSFRQGTVEPQPPPHARSVVAWPVARQGFYGGQPTRYPGSRLSRGRSHSPHPSATGSYDERLTCLQVILEHKSEMTEDTTQTPTEELAVPFLQGQRSWKTDVMVYNPSGGSNPRARDLTRRCFNGERKRTPHKSVTQSGQSFRMIRNILTRVPHLS